MHVRRAFTLVELLVVIGIIAVLVAILLPTLTRSRAAASRTQCLSNQRQLAMAIQMYENRFKGCPPPYIVRGNPGASHRLFHPDLIGPNSKNGYQGWVMLGMLYGTGIITKAPSPSDPPPLMFYCPVQFNPLLRFPDGWYPSIKRGGYAYRLSADVFNESFPPFLSTPQEKNEFKQAYRGRFRKIIALTSDIICADAGVGSNDMLVWSHDRPPFVITGFSDGHAEAVRIPESIYNLATQKLGSSLGNSDRMCLGIFQACDTKDFRRLETWLRTLK